MDYNQILDAVVKLILIPVIPYLGKWFKKLVMIQIEKAKKELEKYELESFGSYVEILDNLAYKTVRSALSVYTEAASELSIGKIKEIKAVSKRHIKEQIPEKDKELLKTRINNIDRYIDDLIESILDQYKQGDR